MTRPTYFFGFHTDDEVSAREEVIGLGNYGKTLTIIVADPQDEDEDGEE